MAMAVVVVVVVVMVVVMVAVMARRGSPGGFQRGRAGAERRDPGGDATSAISRQTFISKK